MPDTLQFKNGIIPHSAGSVLKNNEEKKAGKISRNDRKL